YPGFFSRPARAEAARRLVRRGLVVEVAEPAIAAREQYDTLARTGQIGEHDLLAVIEDFGADRHAQHQLLAVCAGTLAAGAAAPVLGAEMLPVAIVDEGVEIVLGDDDDVSALAAVAAVRAAELDELLAAKAHRAAPAIAALQVDFALVEKFHRFGANRKRGARAAPLWSFRLGKRRLFGGFRQRQDRDEGAAANPAVELDRPLLKREQRVVAADADPVAGMKLGAALAHDDVAGHDDLAAELLDAEAPPAAVAAIPRGPARLFMRHLILLAARRSGRLPLGVDLGDAQHGLVLAMTVLAPVILSPLLLEDDDLGAPPVFDKGRADRRAVDDRRARRHRAAIAKHQHIAQLDGRA